MSMGRRATTRRERRTAAVSGRAGLTCTAQHAAQRLSVLKDQRSRTRPLPGGPPPASIWEPGQRPLRGEAANNPDMGDTRRQVGVALRRRLVSPLKLSLDAVL